jgi:hypothetical protein
MKRTVNRIGLLFLVVVLGAQLDAMGAERPFKADGVGFVDNYQRAFAVSHATHFGHVQMEINFNDAELAGNRIESSIYFYAGNGDYLLARTDHLGLIDRATGVGVATLRFIEGTGRF